MCRYIEMNAIRRILILSLIFAAFLPDAGAQALKAFRDEVPGSYNYWFYTPDSTGQDKSAKPLVIFLHGASLCGSNLDRVKRYGTIDALQKGRMLDAYVVAPQNPGGSWKPDKVMKLVDWAEANYNVDADRVYVIGMSLGGYGTIDLAATYPDRIAAAVAMCGGGSVKDLSRLNDVPLWIIHGTSDRAVSISQSDKVVSAMRMADEDTPRLVYHRIQGMNHSQPARLLYHPEIYDWLFSHTLQDEGRNVSPAFNITNSTLGNAYQGLNMSRRKPAAVKSKSDAAKSGHKSSASKKGSKRSRHS